jgi:RNA polymerase sigma-70 factor (ECF subfamily)
MSDTHDLAERFEAHRTHLRGVAYRMLGSAADADDAVQEAWLRLTRTDATAIDNLGGWLTTVVARVCLDMLRARKSRQEEPMGDGAQEPVAGAGAGARVGATVGTGSPEDEVVLADSVGVALLVVLDRLAPAERVAFVLHDMFAVPFEEIASVLGRSSDAARQLASRARRRVRGGGSDVDLPRQRALIERFLTALRAGDLPGLLAVLDPDLVVRADMLGAPSEIRGAETWAKGAVSYGQMARAVRLALIDGEVGLVLGPAGHVSRALVFRIEGDRITGFDIVGDATRLGEMEIAPLEGS